MPFDLHASPPCAPILHLRILPPEYSRQIRNTIVIILSHARHIARAYFNGWHPVDSLTLTRDIQVSKNRKQDGTDGGPATGPTPLSGPETYISPDRHSKQSSGQCPRCNSEAFYKYGKTRHGKQRFRCLLCGRQFGDTVRVELKNRPLCRICGQKMHVYKRDSGIIRFRCSGYPVCRNFESRPH
jgi:DNA-directed RNA polymerase subunit RPC12/RpoP